MSNLSKQSQQLRDLKNQITNLNAIIDKTLDTFINQVSNSIQSSETARLATRYYTVAWFSTIEYSIEGKRRIAEALITEVKAFQEGTSVQPPKAWAAIVGGDPVYLQRIEYVDTDFTESFSD